MTAQGEPSRSDAFPRIAILLSTCNGARFLAPQLDSFLAQTHDNWMLFWRDDGSIDRTADLMDAFTQGPGAGRSVAVCEPAGKLGVTASFLTLLRAANGAELVAFADQDDVWLPHKLALGAAALDQVPADTPALYCARQILVDERLTHLGPSQPLRRPPGFPAALTQNIATGCTVMLNRAATALVAKSHAPTTTLHDWWSYLVIAAAGGRLIVDGTPTVLYRQHHGNLVGAPASMARRAVGAIRRGPGVFMNVLRCHVAALRAQPYLLSHEAAILLDRIDNGLQNGVRQRLRALRAGGLKRQTWPETWLFRWWFLIG